jgi:hypothetical protein
MSGYRPCACRDCFEIAIGNAGAMCHECEDAGCPGDRECLAAGAYGGEPEECEDNDCAGCSWCDAAERSEAQVDAIADGICASIERWLPAQQPKPQGEIERLLADAPAARPVVEALRASIPDAALLDSRHPYWDSPAAAEVLGAMLDAIDAAAAKL